MAALIKKFTGPLILVFCLTQLCFSQPYTYTSPLADTDTSTGSIKGAVTDVVNGEELPFVTIRFVDSLAGTSADVDGTFELNRLLPGKYSLMATYVGYKKSVVSNLEVIAGKILEVNIRMEASEFMADEVIITASRKPQAAKLAPASVALITSKEIQEKNITTFDQAFDNIPGITVTRSSGANVQAFSIRGASEVAGGGIGNRVLLLIDGRPAISPESGGALWNLVPLNSIEQIEVVKGAYSSLYGSSAMGGVINVITRKPTLKPQTRLHLNYGIHNPAPSSTDYDAFGDYHTLEFSHSRKHKKMDFLLDGGWKSNDGHREKSAFDLYNIFGKISRKFSKDRYLQLSANFNRIKNDTPATWISRSKAFSVAEHRKDDYQDRREYNADLLYYALPGPKVKYSSRFFYYQNYSEFSFNDDPGNDSTNINIGKQTVDLSTVRSQRLGNVTQLDWYPKSNHYVIAGMDLKWDHVNGVPDSVLYGRHEALNLGVYMQDEIKLSPALIATVGIRLDHYNILDEFKETNISPKLAAVYEVNEKFSMRTLLAQAFRNPSMAERFIKFEQGGGLSFRPNPTLRAEKLILSAEMGSKFYFSKTAMLDVALFYNHYRDLISFRQISQPLQPLVYEVINLKKAVMQGIEFTFQKSWGDFLNLKLGYTLLDARDISDERFNDELAYKVKHSFNGSTTASKGKFMLNLSSRYRSRIKEVFIYPGSEPEAAFITNSKLSYLINNSGTFYLAVDNIGNKQYEELERYRMPGRSYTVGLVWKFAE